MNILRAVICAVVLAAASATGATFHVATNGSDAASGTNWASAKLTIQAAIDAAAGGDTILVSNGLYQTGGRVVAPYALTNRVVIDRPVIVRSMNGPSVTIIKGAWHPITTNGNAAVRCVWMTNGASLSGFTLTNGATRTTGDFDNEWNGGGVWALSTAAVVSNCVLSGNSADTYGGGAYRITLDSCILAGNEANSGGGASLAALTNCTLSGNRAATGGGAYVCVLNDCTLSGNYGGSGGGAFDGSLMNCVLSGNTSAAGGGVYQGTLSNCTLSGNTSLLDGGGARFGVLNSCTLSGNKAGLRGGAAYGGTLNSCVLSGNMASNFGGGTYQGALNNCTLSGNTAGISGGGAYLGTLNNCIIQFNAAPTSNNYFNSAISFSCTTPLPGGAGNITNDPMFVDAGAGDLRIRSGSPCINEGNNAAVSVSADADGNPRIRFRTVDMGAYEYQIPGVSGAVHLVVVNNPNARFPYTNWATASDDIQNAIDAAVDGNLVLVSNGVYQAGGQVVAPYALTNRVVIDKAVTVRSVNGPAFTTIAGAKDPLTTNGNAAVRCVWMTNGATLSGFTLTNGATRASGDFGNEWSGGGVWAWSTAATISNCVVVGNSGGLNGGGAYKGTLNNCTLGANVAGSTGGGAHFGALNNCTLAGNSAGTDGGGVYLCTLNNCIVYFNTAPGEANHFISTFAHSCTTPHPGGTGNIAADPLFENGPAGNFRLTAGSPARNTGNNSASVGENDLDGNPRILGGTVDMGSSEFSAGDTDSDGDTDLDEYIAGTNPTNPASIFPRIALTNPPPGAISLVISNTSVGRLYFVLGATNLVPQSWTLLPPELPGTGTNLTLTIPATNTFQSLRTGVRLP